MERQTLARQKLPAADSLRLQHDDIRAGLVTAAMEPGPVAEAAKRVSRLCIPHFEEEEKHLFPALGLLLEVALEDVKPEMVALLPLISRFGLRHERLHHHHQLIASTIETLIAAARKERNRRLADFAYQLWLHEQMEETILYPTVILIGNYIRDRLGLGPRRKINALVTDDLTAAWTNTSGTVN